MFISILYKFGSRVRVIYFSFSSVFFVRALIAWISYRLLVLVRLGQHIGLVTFALLFSCTFHVQSLLVILCSFTCLLFCCFSYRVSD